MSPSQAGDTKPEKPETRTLRDRTSAATVPEASTPNHSRVVSREKPREKTAMDKWVEPAVAAKPSYQEHNGAPFGVLEHMQPLGEAPSAKVKGRVKSENVRKSVLGRSAAATGLDAQETPEGSPAPQRPSPRPEMDAPVLPPAVVDDEKDGDYAPGKKEKKDRHTRSRASRRRSEAHQSIGAPTTKTAKATPPVNTNRIYDAPKLKRVVEAAKSRAIQVGKPDLADAVHEIWSQSLRSNRLTALLEAILTQNATEEQTTEFQDFVRAAKRKLKQHAKDTTTRKTPAAPANNRKSQPPPSIGVFHDSPRPAPAPEVHAALPSTERQESYKPRLSLKVKSPQKQHKESSRRGSTHGIKMSSSPPKKKRSDSVGSQSSSLTSLTSNDEDDADMDGPDELAQGPPALAKKVGGKAKDQASARGSLAAPEQKNKRTSADAELLDDERDRQFAAKKQKLDKTITRDYHYEESNVRTNPTQPPLKSRTTRGQRDSLMPGSVSLAPGGDLSAAVRASRAASADVDSPLSSNLSMPSSQIDSPRHVWTGPTKPTGKRAKTKTSPEKKQLASYSGLSVAGGARRESPIGDDDNEELSENNDFCSACGGSGFLLCCDGCDRAFHFSCLDPPLNEDASELNEPWFCYICVAKRPVAAESPEKPLRGLFAPLLASLKKRNPSNFSLPQDIREYYEGVGTDSHGAFTEAVNTKTRSRPGYDEVPDYYKNTDSKNNVVTCHYCRKSTGGHRAIIKCDYCQEPWHLDCLDPPLANPPAMGYNGKKIHDWMCPLHVDHELRQVDTRLLYPRRRVHVRKPKNATLVETSLKRGFSNNGIIDIVMDDVSDESDSEFYEEETQEESVVYRMPASGIKLDFIDKIKSTRIQHIRDEHVHEEAVSEAQAPSALQQANFARRSFAEQKTALNMAQFASQNKDLDFGQDSVENLVGTLIAEAPDEVLETMMAEEDAQRAKSSASIIPPSPPQSDQTDQLSVEQRQQLQMLQELIRRRLEGSKT